MKKIFTLAAAAMMAATAFAQNYAYTDLTAADFHKWNGYDANATIADENGGGEYALNVSTGLVYGTGSVWGLHYADISAYDVLAVTYTEGTPRCMFNRPGDDGAMPVETPRDSQYYTVVDNGDGSSTVLVDLNLIKSEDKNGDGGNYAHLQAIKGANWANTTVTKLQVGKVDGTTALDVVTTQSSHSYYNILGQLVAAPVKGQMYIQNGRKVVVK